MISRLSLPVMLISTVGLITLGFLAPWSATKAVADPSGDRIGCGTYCQNAGGYGAPGNNAPPAATILSSGTVTADSDGYVPVTVKCNLSVQCSGALLVCLEGPAVIADLGNLGMAGYCGRSDLTVNANATRTIAVPLPAAALAFLRSHGPTSATANADSRPSAGVGSGFNTLAGADLTVAAPG